MVLVEITEYELCEPEIDDSAGIIFPEFIESERPDFVVGLHKSSFPLVLTEFFYDNADPEQKSTLKPAIY